MASGRLGKALLAAITDTKLYTVPNGTVTTATLTLCNTSAAPVAVRVAVATAAAPTPADFIEYDVVLGVVGAPGGSSVIERTGIVLSAGESVVVRAGAAGVAARLHGFEEVAD